MRTVAGTAARLQAGRLGTRRLGHRLPIWFVGAALAVLSACAYLTADRATVIHRTDSPFGQIFVTEDDQGVRSLYFDEGRSRQGAVIPGQSMRLVIPYTRVATVGLALAPKLGRVLFVGLGVGAMPMHARALFPDARIDIVEINPVVVDLAQDFFGFTPDESMRVHVGDGRAFIESAEGPAYDLIVLDAYSDEGIPYHLTTREFLTSVQALLTPGGVVVSNLWESSALYNSMVATFADVFDERALVRVEHRVERILVASGEQRSLDRAALVDAARQLTERVDLGFGLAQLIARGYERPVQSGAPVLGDGLASYPRSAQPQSFQAR